MTSAAHGPGLEATHGARRLPGARQVTRVGFVLCSSVGNPLPSTRIACLNIFPALAAAGFEPVVLFGPSEPTEEPDLEGVADAAARDGCAIVVIQKVHGSSTLALVNELSSRGIRTVYSVCDFVDAAMAEATDATATVTNFLRSLYPARLQSKVYVVHDGIERADVSKSDWGSGKGSRRAPLNAVLVTSSGPRSLPVLGRPPEWLTARIVGAYGTGTQGWHERHRALFAMPRRERLRYLGFLLDRRIVCIAWGPDLVYREMLAADIGIIPIERKRDTRKSSLPSVWSRKSENRLTLKMSVGLPVVATPIPAYEEVIEQGVNGFLAKSRRDWRACLEALRDPSRRAAVGRAARESVRERFSIQSQAEKFIDLLNGLIQ